MDLLQRINENQKLSTLLADAFEFNVKRAESHDAPRLASGLPLESIAGDLTGGRFYLCGTEDSCRSVLYASSEGDAGLIASDLREALLLVVGFPYWRDSLKYSANGNLDSMESAMTFLCRDIVVNRPTIGAEQAWVAELLDLPLEPPSVLVVRLHAILKNAGPEFTFVDDTGEYGSMFGEFPPSRNRDWR
jgi:hypothetical protein